MEEYDRNVDTWAEVFEDAAEDEVDELNSSSSVCPLDTVLIVTGEPYNEFEQTLVFPRNGQLENMCQFNQYGVCLSPGKTSVCSHSLYGSPLPVDTLKELMPKGQTDGLVLNVQLVPDDFDTKYPRLLKVLDKKNYDAVHRCIKPRRGTPAVKASDFFSSLVRIDDDSTSNPRWIFSGVLNGWPALTCLELLRIEFMGALPRWQVYWDSDPTDSLLQNSFQDDSSLYYMDQSTTDACTEPSYPQRSALHIISNCRAVVRMPSWTAKGYSKDSKGHVFWFEACQPVPRLLYGTNILQEFNKELRTTRRIELTSSCVKIHMISHRYSPGEKSAESFKDLLVYHSIALLEWDHQKFSTVVEAAWLNGIGGFNGKSNWIDDKNEPITTLLQCLPPELIMPWQTSSMEIRAYDVASRNLNEFLAFMKKHTGKNHRFLDVNVSFSHLVRLSFCTKPHIAQYLINYISRGKSYSEIRYNCQTFVADFCGFLAGKKDVMPFHPLNRIEYRNHSHFFLYDSSLYY